MLTSEQPRMRRDPYTGTMYDANAWYRGANGLWVNIEAEKRYEEEWNKAFLARCEKRNASRKARGRRPRSVKAFCKSAERYDKFLREETTLSFGEWLKSGGYKW